MAECQPPGAAVAPFKGSLRACWLGRVAYRDATVLQRRLVERVICGGPETLLALEHEPVVTVGRSCGRGEAERVRRTLGGVVDVEETERGGHITYHGPGQLVAYPIVRVERVGRDLKRWLDVLEQAVVGTLGRLGIQASARPGQRGVWANGRKIASVGVAVRRWVSFHGVAINVSARWRPPRGVLLCEMPAEAYGSLEELGAVVELTELANVLALEIAGQCGFRGVTWCDADEL